MYRLLIVDDEEIILNGVKTMIERAGSPFSEIRCAPNGAVALDTAKEFKPHLIITDINMPGMNGLELIAACRQESLCHRFIILTGYDEFEYARQAIRYNVIDFLVKPNNKQELISLVERTGEDIQKEQQEKREIFTLKIKNMLFYNADPEEIQLDESEIEAFLPHEYIQVMAIHSKNHYDKNEFTLSEYFQLKTYIAHKYPDSFIFTSPPMNHIVFLFNIKQELSLEDQREIYDMIFSKDLGKSLHLHLGFSSAEKSPNQLHSLYIEALKASYLNVLLLKAPYSYFYSTDAKLSAHYYDRLVQVLENYQEQQAVREIEKDLKHFLEGKEKDLPYGKKIYLYYLVHLHVYLGTLGLKGEEILNKNQMLDADEVHLITDLDEIKRRILQWVSLVCRSAKRQNQPGNRKESFHKIEQFIRDNYMSHLSLDLISDQFNLHPHYISALFKKEKGIPFLQYLNHYRIEKAKQLLLVHGDLSIKEVSQKVGFESENHFYKLFKKHTSQTPNEFRNEASSS